MLVDAQHPRARSAAPLGQFPLQEILKPPLNRGATDALALT
jgi:hypothetical protein